MKILALDISLRSTGWSVWDSDSAGEALAVGAINPKCFGLDRYKFILSAIGDIEREHGKFDLVTMEGYPFFLFGMKKEEPGKVVRSDAGQGPGNQVFALAEITGLIKMLIHFRWEVPFACFSPKSIKKYATGNGAARKVEMIAQLAEEHAMRFRTNDEVDSWYVGQLTCEVIATSLGSPLPLVAHRKEAIKAILTSNNPEGTFDWTNLCSHDQEFGRKKPKKKRKFRRYR